MVGETSGLDYRDLEVAPTLRYAIDMTDPKPSGSADQTSNRDLLAEIAVMALAVLLIARFGQQTPLMSGLMAGLIIARFLILNRKGDWMFFVLGVVLGGGNDLLSMWKGVYRYTPPTFLPVPIPLWVVFFWGQVFVSFRKLMRWGPFRGPDQPPARLLDAPLALDILIAVIYRLVIYRTAAQPWVPDALFAAILAVRVILIPPPPHERLLMIAMLVIGPAYEILLIGSGLYLYQTGVLLGMPLWLIVYWVFIIRALKAVFDRVEYFIVKG